MKPFEIYIDIEASQQSVWNALLDFDSYENWNPIVLCAKGKLEAGSTLHLDMKGKDTLVKVVAVEEGRKFILSRDLMHKNLIHLDHYFELTPLNHETTRFTQRWQGSGFLTLLLWPNITRKLADFEQFNSGFKSYLEN